MIEHGSWYLTAEWEQEPVRRGDPLGFRGGTDYFADLLAPGLSNAVSDARWISILSWCLKWSHVVWTNAGGGELTRRDDQRGRYAWLRPLELLWVDRTLESGQTTGQLRGRRSIERWRNADRQIPNFAMSPDQFRRYRQVGTYGAYRVVFRTVPGLTTGDGWTPAPTALSLANLVNDSLPRNVRLRQEHFDNTTKWGSWSAGNEARYWIEKGWQNSSSPSGGFLPTPENALSKRLPEAERRLIEAALFGAGSVRRLTAEVLVDAKSARSHIDLCHTLANSNKLSKKIHPASLASLPSFSHFADTAMHAMRGLWDQINSDETKQAPTVAKLARSTDLQSRFELLRDASGAWLRAPGRIAFPHDDLVARLATAMRDAASPLDQLKTLARHHQEYGGGRRWFREQSGKLIPLVADTGIVASDYRFRLRPLSRLAAQCGVASMKATLKAVDQPEFDSIDGLKSEDADADTL